jgi:hypothetical protein
VGNDIIPLVLSVFLVSVSSGCPGKIAEMKKYESYKFLYVINSVLDVLSLGIAPSIYLAKDEIGNT